MTVIVPGPYSGADRGSKHVRSSPSSLGGQSENTVTRFRKDYIRPQKFSGTGSFETFYAHFQNCAAYNRWTEKYRLAHLKACFISDAGQVLWDSSPEATDTLQKLTDLLKNRFGPVRQQDKHRMELRLRRRRSQETLIALHQDVRRLMALAYPNLEHSSRETLAFDYFIDALDDAVFALKSESGCRSHWHRRRKHLKSGRAKPLSLPSFLPLLFPSFAFPPSLTPSLQSTSSLLPLPSFP